MPLKCEPRVPAACAARYHHVEHRRASGNTMIFDLRH
jgi:hypothetical protein